MQNVKVDWSREGRLVLQDALMDCCDIGLNRLVCLMQVEMFHAVVYIQPLCDQHGSKIIVYRRRRMIKNGNLLSN